MVVVTDATPLIVLGRAGDLDLLRALFGVVLVPPAVLQEVTQCGPERPGSREVAAAAGDWVRVQPVAYGPLVHQLRLSHNLDAGEAEALVLVEERPGAVLLIDERRAVAYARSAGIQVLRTPALYGLAKARGLIDSVRPRLDVLRRNGFWLSDRDYEGVLRAFGE